MRKYTFTSESVTEGHPDKMADQVSDAVLDALLAADPRFTVISGSAERVVELRVQPAAALHLRVELPRTPARVAQKQVPATRKLAARRGGQHLAHQRGRSGVFRDQQTLPVKQCDALDQQKQIVHY